MSKRSDGDFNRAIVMLVRRMPDEAILALLRHRLLGSHAQRSRSSSFGRARGTPVRRRAPTAKHTQFLALVERIVGSMRGVTLKQLVALTRAPPWRVLAALERLKLEGRLFQTGKPRFTWYAENLADAKRTSGDARATGSPA